MQSRWTQGIFATSGRTQGIQGVLELGANIGLNLIALKKLLPKSNLSAVEINEKAAAKLKEALPEVDLHLTSIIEFQPKGTWDLVFTKGVLIHISPEKLSEVYKLLYRSSSQYILICEYYSPKPTDVIYRGHTGKLFKRDFAGEMLEAIVAELWRRSRPRLARMRSAGADLHPRWLLRARYRV